MFTILEHLWRLAKNLNNKDNKKEFKMKDSEFLIAHGDVLSLELPKKLYKEVALKLSIDMYTIHTNSDDNANRFKYLIEYFSKRKGVWDEDIKKPEAMALKMFLMGLLASDVYPGVCETADVKETAFNISFEILEEGAVSCTIGIHKDVPESQGKILRKLIDIHMNQMFYKLKYECDFLQLDGVLGINNEAENDTEVDEETSKALERLSWDKTVKGEA